MSSLKHFIKALGVIFGLKSQERQGRRSKKASPQKKPASQKVFKNGRKQGGRKKLPSGREKVSPPKKEERRLRAAGRTKADPHVLKVVKKVERGVASSKKKSVALAKVGEITHFFNKISVAVVRVTNHSLVLGDKIRIQGELTDFVQVVRSMQVESLEVKVAKKGELVGLKVNSPVRVQDSVYKY